MLSLELKFENEASRQLVANFLVDHLLKTAKPYTFNHVERNRDTIFFTLQHPKPEEEAIAMAASVPFAPEVTTEEVDLSESLTPSSPAVGDREDASSTEDSVASTNIFSGGGDAAGGGAGGSFPEAEFSSSPEPSTDIN